MTENHLLGTQKMCTTITTDDRNLLFQPGSQTFIGCAATPVVEYAVTMYRGAFSDAMDADENEKFEKEPQAEDNKIRKAFPGTKYPGEVVKIDADLVEMNNVRLAGSNAMTKDGVRLLVCTPKKPQPMKRKNDNIKGERDGEKNQRRIMVLAKRYQSGDRSTTTPELCTTRQTQRNKRPYPFHLV